MARPWPKAHISIWYADGCWHALSTDPSQGGVGGTAEIVLATVSKWLPSDALEAGDVEVTTLFQPTPSPHVPKPNRRS